MSRRRAGFTIIEILVIFALMALIVTIALPKTNQWRARSRLTSARQTVAASVASARAAAVQKGYTGYFIINDNRVSVAVDVAPPGSGTSAFVVIQEVDLLSEYHTTLRRVEDGVERSVDTIRYDPRGFAFPRLPDPVNVLRLESGPRRDSVCIASMGQILPRGCAL